METWVGDSVLGIIKVQAIAEIMRMDENKIGEYSPKLKMTPKEYPYLRSPWKYSDPQVHERERERSQKNAISWKPKEN